MFSISPCSLYLVNEIKLERDTREKKGGVLKSRGFLLVLSISKGVSAGKVHPILEMKNNNNDELYMFFAYEKNCVVPQFAAAPNKFFGNEVPCCLQRPILLWSHVKGRQPFPWREIINFFKTVYFFFVFIQESLDKQN